MSDDVRSRRQAVIVLAACLTGVWFSQLTLWHTDLWGHLSYGRLIVERGEIPKTEPFIPTATETPLVDTAWLTQVVGYLTIQRLGAAGLQTGFGICVGISFLFLVLACQRRSHSTAWAIVCGMLFLGVASEQLRIIRPQVIGLVLFCYLLFEFSAPRITRRAIVSIGLAFCLWANTHPSYPVGLLLLAAAIIDRYRARIMTVRQAALVLLIAVVATFVNPYGPMVYQTVLGFASSPNLTDIVEWQPISLDTRQGIRVLATAVVILIGWCVPRQRPDLAIALLLGCYSLLLFRYSRFVVWWSVLACFAVSHFEIIAARLGPIDKVLRRIRVSRNTLLALLIAGCVFGLSQFEQPQPRMSPPRFGPRTPVEATSALTKADLPVGTRVFTSYHFADYVLWRTWPKYQVLLTSHVHLLPPTQWQRYLTVSQQREGWLQEFEELNATAVVLDMRRHAKVAHALEQTGNWQLLLADEVAIALIRKQSVTEQSE